MLWTLIKLLAFVAIVTAITWGAVWLLGIEGGARITMAGSEINLTPLQLVIGFLVLVVALWIALKVLGLVVATLRWINGDDNALSRYFSRNRERRGYEALSEGMLALAAGEGTTALAKAEKAERYLHRPELTTLLTAQAADQAGNRAKAEAAYRELITHDHTRFVGIKGILAHKLADGDQVTARKLAEKAFEIKPKNAEIQDTLLRLQAESNDWAGARRTLGAKLRSGTLPKDVYKRRDAVLALSEAKGVFDDGKPIEAREEAIEANRMSPDLIPGAVMAARGYIEKGNKRYATRILKKAWDVQPHPDLAEAFAEIEPDETPAQRKKRFVALTQLNADNPETRMLKAELEIADEDFPAARRALGDLNETDPTARSLTLMAAIERGSGADEAVVRGWLTRALSAPRGPQWVCDNCQHIHGSWVPVCSNCHGFDTLSWRRPADGEAVAMPASTEMLPLVVGPPTGTEVAVVEPADAEIAPEPEPDPDGTGPEPATEAEPRQN